jgi:hypothetical protein
MLTGLLPFSTPEHEEVHSGMSSAYGYAPYWRLNSCKDFVHIRYLRCGCPLECIHSNYKNKRHSEGPNKHKFVTLSRNYF